MFGKFTPGAQMNRDNEQFPDDENGDVLWRMVSNGDNLSKSREVDFPVIFPTEDAALKFAVQLLRNGEKVTFGPYESNAYFPWQVEVRPVLLPTHEIITKYENLLAKESEAYGGVNDGWGSYAQD